MASYKNIPLSFDARGGRGEFRLSKLRGQHFLTDANVVRKIIAAAELREEDLVLEVGPGLGVMTREILPRVGRLVAVELDPLFVRELRNTFAAEASPRLEIIEGDILKMRISDLVSSFLRKQESTTVGPGVRRDDGVKNGYKLISNLPYNITSAFLKKFLIEPPHPRLMVVMVQKEVAERICVPKTNNQKPNSKPVGMLGLMCNLYAECSMVCKVPASSFAPPPKVDSAVIALKPYNEKEFDDKWGFERGLAEDLLAFISRFFAQPRKKMSGLLNKVLAEKCRSALAEIGESPDSRPAALSLEKWVELWKKLR